WGFSLGEDACLFEDDKEAPGLVSEHLSDPGDTDHRNSVKALIDNITDDLEKEEGELSAHPEVHSGE
ncbi:hypothetical protein A2U01_0112877, partial [Trifolium medium]|nr:hypothetical protein [Trifolium medium]